MVRLAIRVTGMVQGVGFRPFVYRLANQLKLSGWVKNDGCGVLIEAEGSDFSLSALCRALTEQAPPLAAIEQVQSRIVSPAGTQGFTIQPSDTAVSADTLLFPDIATCDACRRELLDPADRRFRYPFINCTECGPRYSIVRGLPYDRPATTMAGFLLCPSCRHEYEQPADRRFHAQPNACSQCGPQCRLLDAAGNELAAGDVFEQARQFIGDGAIVAIKGIGGWHLACNARNRQAVAGLRRRKQRQDKPFAVMAGSLTAACRLCHISPLEETLLTGRERPIVLLAKSEGYDLAEQVAPHTSCVGVMLPYAPVHWLLLATDDCWVMTSGNRRDEPIVYEDGIALRQLAGLADYFLSHNRTIAQPVDDSIVQSVAGTAFFIRRSRGFVPAPVQLSLPQTAEGILAVGAEQKNTFCLVKKEQAFISPHFGELTSEAAYVSFCRSLTAYQRLFSIRPGLIAHDLHPGYRSTRHALASGLPVTPVQHHHAHIAAVMAEQGINGPVIGVALDGTGFGEDGAIWGGEFLIADLTGFKRAAHFAYLPLPGGEKAVREPWRLAAWLLYELFGTDAAARHPDFIATLPDWWPKLVSAPLGRLGTPLTSSAGRLFDAAAALLGIRSTVHYEGQAAIELEQLANQARTSTVLSYSISEGEPLVIDFRPVFAALVAALRQGRSREELAAAFHATMADAVCQTVIRLAAAADLSTVILSGGVFQNMRLLNAVAGQLAKAGLSPCWPRQIPLNDGGLCLGQAAIAAARRHNGLV